MRTTRLALAAAVLAAATAAVALSAALPAPAEFRGWAHVKSMVITDKSHGLYGFHDVYADPAALQALKSGGAYPEGARFAVSFYDVTTEGPMLSQGKKRMDTFMRKDKAATATGGWTFAASGPDGKPLALDVVKGCYECHAGGAKQTDLVFSKWVE
ncbi:MAG TPA: cytochrome P460 family protein [Anaeromyxobacteraceae bacterium]|nr:cytochrome P460 family protein [Anaeromyxobacteraceae bacterium]